MHPCLQVKGEGLIAGSAIIQHNTPLEDGALSSASEKKSGEAMPITWLLLGALWVYLPGV